MNHRHTARGVQGGRRRLRPPVLWVGYPGNGHEAVSGVAHWQGIEGSGKGGPG
jgi:hypothetical protein